ncbi:DUF4179 domain-containing protein [Paenibacillus prosopidis]|uniref:Uncharacterized protein DUF4179 n=1 Tax=Paenibacillus prosopidis TaxID=630520 RepID=A0A368W3H9_9BACL|nr:DUF4179 domain-containing protein [Paenibacillus prosopidis]RCW49347.1 uncharacterized protein DUF4179 [Paenibacillus prosopidis]
MKTLEKDLIRHLKEDKIPYPDFEAMWNGIQQAEDRRHENSLLMEQKSMKLSRWKKTIIASCIALLCVATPVFAWNWNFGDLLKNRSGIQTALNKGLGQKIDQSVTHAGVTFTLHTALVDENRTFFVYSINIGDRSGDHWNFENMKIMDEKGNTIDGSYNHQWDEKHNVLNGYFETDWIPSQSSEQVRFSALGFQSLETVTQPIALELQNASVQTFAVELNGIDTVTVQPLIQESNEVMLSSMVAFSDSKVFRYASPQLIVKSNNKLIKGLNHASYGEPGINNEFKMKQLYSMEDLKGESTQYLLQYNRMEERLNKEWAFNIELNKKSMNNSTYMKKVNIAVDHANAPFHINELIISPTQIRLLTSHEEKYMRYPFIDFFLEVDGATWQGGEYFDASLPQENTLRFERPAGLEITKDSAIFLIGKYEVVWHEGGEEPITLKAISEQKQTITTNVGDYPVKWTYYRKEGAVYLESGSDNPAFGGINQTYRMTEEGKIPSEQLTNNFTGDGNNKAIEKFRDYSGDELTIYIYQYTTDDPSKEMKIPLPPME